MIKRKTAKAIIKIAAVSAFVAVAISWVYGSFFVDIDTEEIDLYYDLLIKEGHKSPDFILDLGVREGEDLQVAVDRIKKAMVLKDYDIWLSSHGDKIPPAYIERKGPFLTIYFSTYVKLLREKINVLVHEIGHVYVWGLRGGVPKGYDEEKIVDISGVFLGLGIPVLNGFTDVTSIVGSGEYRTEQKFYGYLTPDEFGYILAKYCAINGIDAGNVAAFLNSSGKKYFSKGCNYLARQGDVLEKTAIEKQGAFWCPACGYFNHVDVSERLSGIKCLSCGWSKKLGGFSEFSFLLTRGISGFIYGSFHEKLSLCPEYFSSVDKSVFFFFNRRIANPVGDAVVQFFLKVPGRYIIVPMFFVFLFSRRKYLKNTAMIGLASYAVTHFAYEAIKFAVKRPRPFLALENVRLIEGTHQGYSFPSGHASIAFCVATVLAMRYPKIRYPVLIIAGFVAISRMYLGFHYPSDVVVGAFLGALIGYFVTVSGNAIESGKKRR